MMMMIMSSERKNQTDSCETVEKKVSKKRSNLRLTRILFLVCRYSSRASSKEKECVRARTKSDSRRCFLSINRM